MPCNTWATGQQQKLRFIRLTQLALAKDAEVPQIWGISQQASLQQLAGLAQPCYKAMPPFAGGLRLFIDQKAVISVFQGKQFSQAAGLIHMLELLQHKTTSVVTAAAFAAQSISIDCLLPK